MNEKINIIFAGTPEFSVPFLKSLIDDPVFDVRAVVTQPDKPAGRKKTLTPPPVKELAQEHNLNILQPNKIGEINDKLKKLNPDVMVVVAYGQIIPQETLDIAGRGNINVHPSLLPKYRGPSPMQATILNGDKETAITIMLMDEKMDHGDILAQEKFNLTSDETGETLHDKSTEIGAPLLVQTMKDYISGEIKPQEQDHDKAVFCKMIKKEDGKIDWNEPAEIIERKIRAFHSWPGTWTSWNGKRLKILPKVEIINNILNQGEIKLANNKLVVGCGKDSLVINKLQLEGKKVMDVQEFQRGNPDIIGSILE